MRPPRMTTRWWMIAVVVVGWACMLEHRRRSFTALAAYHQSKLAVMEVDIETSKGIRRHWYLDQTGYAMTADELKAAEWHKPLAEKYRHAARYPWLPVEPDPPPPEGVAP